MIALDVHQHLWPEAVLRVLELRSAPPRARWLAGLWEIEPVNEPPFVVDPAEHDPTARAEQVADSGLDRALVSLSPPVGAQALPDAVAAWSTAAADLPSALGWWAAVPLAATPDEQAAILRAAIDGGAAGLCMPAEGLSTIGAAESALPLLHELDRAGAPLFVHPGTSDGTPGDPGWWSPATSYVMQMHAAWHAFHAVVRPALPELRAIFALLAGLAPLHLERSSRKGAPLPTVLDDPQTFYETSSYGHRAIGAMARLLGSGQFVYGTDHPVAVPETEPLERALGATGADLLKRENAARALGYAWNPA